VLPEAFVTVCDSRRVADAFALGADLRAGHPDALLVVVVGDACPAPAAPDGSGIEVLTGRDVAGEDLLIQAAVLDPAPFVAWLEHLALAHLADRARAVTAVPLPALGLGTAVEPAPFTRGADGTPMTPRLRRLFAAAVAGGTLDRTPFDPPGWAAFQHWLLTDGDPAAPGVSRYLAAVHREREDLHGLYPDLASAQDRDGFLGWAAVHGTHEGVVPAWAAPPLPPHVVPPPDGIPALGVNVAGYFRSEVGVGEAARRVVDALDAAAVPLLPVTGGHQPPSRRGHDATAVALEAATFPLNLVCVNADGLPAFLREAGTAFRAGRVTVGLWWWELPDFPDDYRDAFAHVDEVWVGTRYVQEALAAVSPVPVVRVPLPVVAPVPAARTREELGLPEGFLVLFVLDHNSVMERKNPLGLIEAFTRAFPAGGDGGEALVIKTINAERHPEAHARLVAAAQAHPGVHVIDGYLDAPERDALLAACDVYASLHRAEGFGLTVAEAMALGRPVVATDWSGTSDLTTPDTAWLVPHELVPVGPGNEPYAADNVWAEPDLDAAAAALRDVRERPHEAAARAAAARQRILTEHSPEACGTALRARLEALWPIALERARAHDGDPVAEIHDVIQAARERAALGPEDFAAQGGLSARVRRAILQATRAQTANQQATDAKVIDAVGMLAELTLRAREQALADRRAAAHLTAAQLARQRALARRT